MKKNGVLFLSVVVCMVCLFANSNNFAQEEVVTNEEVIALVKAGVGKEIIINKIRKSSTNFDLSTDGLIKLKESGVDDDIVTVMFESKNGKITSNTPNKSSRLKDELGTLFPVLKNSVVTVWSEFGHGSGFIISNEGLIITNFHVIGPSRFLAVQFDESRKVEATVLATDPKKDIAVIWANTEAFTEALPAKIVDINLQPTVEEGERVLAIGSPLKQKKIMTTGIVSKVEERAIISDVNINFGNSGGPLFNSLGEVIGINTFGDFSEKGGPGVSGIIRIELAIPLIEEANRKSKEQKIPSSRLLPVEPIGEFPLDAIKDVAVAKKFDFDPYIMEVGKFSVTLITPSLKYRLATENEREAMKGRKKREEKSEIKGTFNPFQDFYGWAEYLGEYKPVLQIRATPEIAETGGSLFSRMLVGGLTGVRLPAKVKFKADFYKMKLFCGEKEVEPIQPSKIARLFNETNYLISLKDATYEGFYTYHADAINSQCSEVRIEIFSEQKPNEPQVEKIKPKYLAKLQQDFEPYFEYKRKNSNL